uniref:Uncharacterized protein n=1 Tax=Arundo donax TaxID=35708 RepID=A0A0A8XNH6_ARUDO
MHLSKQVCVSLLKRSTLYSISFSAIPNICSFSKLVGPPFAAIATTHGEGERRPGILEGRRWDVQTRRAARLQRPSPGRRSPSP